MFAFWILFFPFKFQSILSQGEWPYKSNNARPSRRFQSTLPQGEWPVARELAKLITQFQSTLPQGEWQDLRFRPWLADYFNPHSRKGSDEEYNPLHNYDRHISIHTPARGVTIKMHTANGYIRFQSTLPQGEWLDSPRQVNGALFHFNPHSRKGSDFRRIRRNEWT